MGGVNGKIGYNHNGNPPYNTNPTSNTVAESQRLYRLNAGSNKTGLGMTLKVMAGDQLNVYGRSYYFQNSTGSNNSAVAVEAILGGLLGGATGGAATGQHGPVTVSQLLGDPATVNPVSSFLSSHPDNTTPKAYINYLLFDEQFHCVGTGASPVGGNSVVKDHRSELQGIQVAKNGYLYVYCSNESPVDVFFDNLQVVHARGPLLEETHYYPFGLTMAGISSKSAGSLTNRNKFNGGNELQSGEFSDGSGLELYDAKNRMYDAQIGRFGQIDPLADMSQNISSYVFASNNPISINDPLGLQDSTHKLPTVTVVGYIKNKWNSFTSWFSGSNVGYNGSGWGHGPRQWLANQYGLGNNANNLWELGLHSQLQSSQVNLTGNLLNKLKTDPAMVTFQNKIIAALKLDPRFRKLAFVTKGGEGVQFGGQRWGSKNEDWGALNGNNPALHGETWAVGGNELTWAVRHAEVDYTATVKTDGTIVVSFHLSDRLDLSAQPGRSEAYNNISATTGFLYHDVVGGNSAMKVNADWQTTVK